MAVDWKERSEIIKNLASTAAVVVGGLWVLYQWDTMFPKTSADVRSAAAAVRTDVSGAFAVQLGMDGDGSEVPFKAPQGAGSEDQSGLSEYCGANPDSTLIQSTPVFAQLTLKSASGIPVRARVERVDLSTAPIAMAGIAPVAEAKGSASPVPTTSVASIDDDSMFFGGLRENRVERGQEIQVAMMFTAKIPLRCTELERLLLVRTQVSLTAIDPTKDVAVGPPVPKVFISTCQLNPRTAPVCNVKEINALGQ